MKHHKQQLCTDDFWVKFWFVPMLLKPWQGLPFLQTVLPRPSSVYPRTPQVSLWASETDHGKGLIRCSWCLTFCITWANRAWARKGIFLRVLPLSPSLLLQLKSLSDVVPLPKLISFKPCNLPELQAESGGIILHKPHHLQGSVVQNLLWWSNDAYLDVGKKFDARICIHRHTHTICM